MTQELSPGPLEHACVLGCTVQVARMNAVPGLQEGHPKQSALQWELTEGRTAATLEGNRALSVQFTGKVSSPRKEEATYGFDSRAPVCGCEWRNEERTTIATTTGAFLKINALFCRSRFLLCQHRAAARQTDAKPKSSPLCGSPAFARRTCRVRAPSGPARECCPGWPCSFHRCPCGSFHDPAVNVPGKTRARGQRARRHGQCFPSGCHVTKPGGKSQVTEGALLLRRAAELGGPLRAWLLLHCFCQSTPQLDPTSASLSDVTSCRILLAPCTPS